MRVFRVYRDYVESTFYVASSLYRAMVWIKDQSDKFTYNVESLEVDADVTIANSRCVRAEYDDEAEQYNFRLGPT